MWTASNILVRYLLTRAADNIQTYLPTVDMPRVADNNNNSNTTTSTKTHNDYSLTNYMKKAVSLWDRITVAHKRRKLTMVRWPDYDGVLLSEEEWIDKVMSEKTHHLCKSTYLWHLLVKYMTLIVNPSINPSVDMQQIINAREQE